MKKQIRFICILLSLMQLLLLSCFAEGASENASAQSIEVSFGAFFSEGDRCWDFPYDDALFLVSADEYSHSLARASLGMALASGRSKQEPFDSAALAYFTQAGFSAIECKDYHGETSQSTIATTICHKPLPNGETLIAIGIGGTRYGNEWLGNLDIGNGTVHRGFALAADKVTERLTAYLEKHSLGQSCKLWISGYSRAAAVANLVSASLTEQGLFHTQDIFAYTFATPRTTQHPVAYPNIFNITGKFDPATKIPYAEWGFGRNGVDLYTPSQETDSRYRQRLVQSSAVYEQLTGAPLQTSPGINHNFTIIAEYITSVVPSSEYYDKHMHAHIEAVWKDPNPITLHAMINALSAPNELTSVSDLEKKQKTDDLADYLFGIVYGIVSDAVINWDQADRTGTAELLMEHSPETYIAWLFSSDDPEEVFSDQMEYLHLMVEGDADVTLFDQKGGFVLSLGADGQYSEQTSVLRYHKRIRPLHDRPLIAASGTYERMLVLPKDQGMPFVIDALSDDTFSYYGVKYHVSRCRPTVTSVRFIDMLKGEQYLAFSFTEDGMKRMNAADHVWGDSDYVATIVEDGSLLSINITSELEGFESVNIDLKTIVIVLIVICVVCLLLLLLLLFLLIRLIIRIVRKFKKRFSRPKVTEA